MAKFCVNCGAKLDTAAKFCLHCGEKQQEIISEPQQEPEIQPLQSVLRFCANCGKQIDEDSKFCLNCGEKQQETVPQPPAQLQPIMSAQQPQQQIQFQPPQPVLAQQEKAAQSVQQQYTPNPTYDPAAQAVSIQAKPKKKSKLPLILTIAVVFLIGIGAGVYFLITNVFGILDKAAKEDYYKIGNDEIPSVKLALGEERKIVSTSTSASISGGSTTKEIKYEVSGTSQKEEISRYLNYLYEKNGFILRNENHDNTAGFYTAARNSVDEGYEIELKIDYGVSGYTITILKQKGSVPVWEEDPYEEETTENPEEEDPYEDPTENLTEEPEEEPEEPEEPYGINDNSLLVGVWRYAGDFDVNVYVFNSDDTFRANMYFYDGTLITSMSGKYNISGDEILMTGVRYAGSLQKDDYSYYFEYYGGIMIIAGVEYYRVPEEDEAEVLADPFYGLSLQEYEPDEPYDSLENISYYELSGDWITSITQVVGYRNFIYYNTEEDEDGVITVTAIYFTDPDDYTQAANDIGEYFQYLLDNDGFISLVDFDGILYSGETELRFAKISADDGYIIILEIDYDPTGYMLTFMKGEGSLTIW